jgi:pyruvate/2-oxoglutarate/acetoin dehydrogenase E1 component
MTYKEAVKKSMEMLSEEKETVFLGYNICFGSKAYGTLTDIPNSKKIETPVAENLMMGLAMGMALEGYRPVVFFERHDFLLNASDAIINHLSKLEKMSHGQFNLPVIIRAIVGSTKPLYPGLQHIQDFSEIFKKIEGLSVYEPKNSKEIFEVYNLAKKSKGPVMVIEKKDLYEGE